MTNDTNQKYYQRALDYHEKAFPGKIGTSLTKPLSTQQDLSLAYSPGVAAPCLEIAKDKTNAYRYTNKGNLVAVITNGTAVLGLGNIGPDAAKPVMEGKAALFKKFAGIDATDLEIATEDPEQFINIVKHLSPSFGGINLEDIKAPECFIIEDYLKAELNIPVFHDDQHGTAIVVAAALINAISLVNKKFEEIKIVVSGAGAAAIACLKLLLELGVRKSHIILCDTKGVIYKGRTTGMNSWKEDFANETNHRNLSDAIKNADVFLGLSTKGILSKEMVLSMANSPIIFAMANPEPEITPEEVHTVRKDAIVATGRSDYPNQVNNVMCFPYLFRGALDVRASVINTEMKLAASKAIADIAKLPIEDLVFKAYDNNELTFGPNYIIPTPFDTRLLSNIPVAVAKAAIDTGTATIENFDLDSYKTSLEHRIRNKIE